MSDGKLPLAPAPNSTSWDPDVIFVLLSDPIRRQALWSLAQTGPQSASALSPGGGKRLASTFKHLTVMQKAGLIFLLGPNPKDRRKLLFALSPSVLVRKTETGWEIDFGCCKLWR